MDRQFKLELLNSKKKIIDSFYDSSEVMFLSSWGNIGDELIYRGTKQLLAGFHYNEIDIRKVTNERSDIALVCGSGGWAKHFNELPAQLLKIKNNFKKIIVLPSTYDTSEEFIRNALTNINALYFARERVSYEKIKELWNADLALDGAFYFNFDEYRRDGKGILNAFRTDAATIWQKLPEDNLDISVTCANLEEWLETIAQHEIIRTDRAHVMIAAALLGKQVEYTTAYDHKVPAIAEYALESFPVYRIPDPQTSIIANKKLLFSQNFKLLPINQIHDNSVTVKFADFLSQKIGCKVARYDRLSALCSDPQLPTDSILLVPDGIETLSTSFDLVPTLKEILKKEHKLILLDDAASLTSSSDIELLMKKLDLPIEFVGQTNEVDGRVKYVTILSRSIPDQSIKVPDDFRVIALIAMYNEADIIEPVLEFLIKNGIDSYIIDNWSNDGTFEKAQQYLNKGVIGIERWPAAGSSGSYDWGDILQRKEQLSKELKANWFIHYDADEIRKSPWENLDLHKAIYYVDQQGYNAIDFTVLDFKPVDNSFKTDMSPEDHFEYFVFGTQFSDHHQIKAWKQTAEEIDLVSSGGHEAKFSSRKVFPYKFMLKHYPIRSQFHGDRKVFSERITRWNKEERKKGWHTQYDSTNIETVFLKRRNELILFTDHFKEDFLFERLSGIGIPETSTNENDIPLEKFAEIANENIFVKGKFSLANHENISLHTKVTELIAKDLPLKANLSEVYDENLALKADLSGKYSENLSLKTELSEVKAEKLSLKSKFAEMNNEISRLQDEIVFYAASTSWRITRPLRKITKFIKGQ